MTISGIPIAIKTVIVWELIAGTIANLHPPLKS